MAPVMDHPPVVDLSNFEQRKEEIVADLMKAATTVGMVAVLGATVDGTIIQGNLFVTFDGQAHFVQAGQDGP